MENLRYLLYQYESNTSLYFGYRYSIDSLPQGYMAGGGYILSKKALVMFVEKLLPSSRKQCQTGETFAEDLALGENH